MSDVIYKTEMQLGTKYAWTYEKTRASRCLFNNLF